MLSSWAATLNIDHGTFGQGIHLYSLIPQFCPQQPPPVLPELRYIHIIPNHINVLGSFFNSYFKTNINVIRSSIGCALGH
jgi:hypothetical protein